MIYKLKAIKNYYFNLLVTNFPEVTWLTTLFVSPITINAVISFGKFFSNTMKIDGIKIIDDNTKIKFLTNIPSQLKINPVNFIGTLRSKQRVAITNLINAIKIIPAISNRFRLLPITLKISPIKIIATPLVGTVYNLGYWNASTLGDLNANTLVDMYYSV